MPFTSKVYKRFTAMLAAGIILVISLQATAQESSEIASRLAITDKLTQYSYRWDGKDSAGFAELFTEDAVIERWVLGELVEGSRLEGRSSIYEYAKQSHEGRLADRQTRHHLSGIVFLELGDDTALTENMALITHQTANDRAARISSSGIYRISWRKSDGEWLMSKRVLRTDRFEQ